VARKSIPSKEQAMHSSRIEQQRNAVVFDDALAKLSDPLQSIAFLAQSGGLTSAEP